MTQTIAVAFTGASGMPYGMRLVDCLLAAGCRVWLLYSQVAQVVARQEMGIELPSRPAEVQAMLRARFKDEDGRLQVIGSQRLPIPGRGFWLIPAPRTMRSEVQRFADWVVEAARDGSAG